jgi:hypothetical protein
MIDFHYHVLLLVAVLEQQQILELIDVAAASSHQQLRIKRGAARPT